MKNYYSKCFDIQYKAYNKLHKKLKTKEAVLNYMKNNNSNVSMQDLSHQITLDVEFDLFENELAGNTVHIYFQEKFLKEYLKEMEINDLQGISQYLFENGESDTIVLASSKTNDSFEAKSYKIYFCLHIPNETDGYCFSVQCAGNDYVFVSCIHNNRVLQVSQKINEKKESLINPKTENEIQNAEAFKLAINTLSYINAFPECLIDKKPEGVVLQYSFKNKKISLKTTPQFKEFENEINVTPHFRRGHFRRLESDRFVNKKGQIVFVKPTIVKGYNYKTLLTDSSIKNT